MRLLLAALLLAACQDNIATPFPAGLEPFEDNKVAAEPDGPFVEMLRTTSSDDDFIRVYARGFVLAPPAMLWDVAKHPEPNVSTCKTDEQIVTPANEPQYEYSFLVHYIVHDILTVEWDDQWRFGTIDDTLDMIRHQKVQGSDFITLSEGTIQLLATADPNVSELAFVEHLDATSATAGDVLQGVQHNYDALVATVHGNPIPACP
ncbi:MAG TPA: hypothetical protein VIV40_03570 [Kofleriaceae bacterium]